MKYLINAFSFNMLADLNVNLRVRTISLEDARLIAADYQSAVGHADTARIYSEQLGVEVPMVRATVALQSGDELLVGQYRGPRLPEGATTLPAGATIVWCIVRINH